MARHHRPDDTETTMPLPRATRPEQPRGITVHRRSTLATGLAALILLGLTAWGTHHVIVTSTTLATGLGHRFGLLFTAAFVMLAATTVLYSLERPRTATPRQRRHLDALRVVVVVPAFNEDPILLRRCLATLIAQDRRPAEIHLIDDGTTDPDALRGYPRVRAEAQRTAAANGIMFRWLRTPNGGKRRAQGLVFAATPDADVYVTVDSDAYLPADAVAQLLLPFADATVQSVAGVVLASNVRSNWLTRLTDLWFVTGQLVDRSAASVTGSVLVNSGPLAAYRGPVCRDNLAGYLGERFAGRPVEFSDDSMLTLYALERGRAVQQPTAVALTAMPETVSHHLRQYLRWMRGATIRSVWRFRYLRLSSVAYWLHALGWVQMVLAMALFVALFVVGPARGEWSPWLLLVPVLIGVAQSLRYLTVARSDVPLRQQVLTVALSPLATVWAFVVLRLVRWYGMATCLRTGWGTRATVEVTG